MHLKSHESGEDGRQNENKFIAISLNIRSKFIAEKASAGASSSCIFNDEQNNARDTGQVFNDGSQETRRSAH